MATTLHTIPCWISLYQEQTEKYINKDFGFDKHGLWFVGDAEGYPVQTNVEFDTNDVAEVIFTVDHNYGCSDQGIAFFRSNATPEWSFGSNSSRIAFELNCPEPHIYGQSSSISGGDILNYPNFYTFRVVYDPNASCDNVVAYTYAGQGTDGELLSTIALSETLPAGTYRIGLSADSDGGEGNPSTYHAYFTYLSILRNGVDIGYQEYILELDAPNTASEGAEGSLDTAKINGHSIQRTGYIGFADCSGGFKVVVKANDNSSFTNQTQSLGDVVGIVANPVSYPTTTPCP